MNQYKNIYTIVRLIPAGCVATYGDIATRAGLLGRARMVGYALHALSSETDIPWHRVINAKGGISLGQAYPGSELRQRRLLEAEGVEFDANSKVNLKRFRWSPDRIIINSKKP